MGARARLTAICMAACVALAGLALSAGGDGAAAEPRGVRATPLPDVPAARGGRCVAEPDVMRRQHMRLLDHQRDRTVQAGVRGEPYSLRACIACHAVEGADGRPVGADDPRHFCRACHDYTAVRIDCFECHASRPGEEDAPAAALIGRDEHAALVRHLREVGP